MTALDHIAGQTFHGRRGDVKNAFRYGVDYILLDPEETSRGPALFSRNRHNLTSLFDRDHGGKPSDGRGVQWVREQLRQHGVDRADGKILLLAQPRVLGHVFNPVSFWLCHGTDGTLRATIAEVSNTYGDRHSYICFREDGAPITRSDTIEARKIFHVSPFQPVEGNYRFRFDIREDRVGVWIDFSTAHGGLYATLTGPRKSLTNATILKACLLRPFGSRRVLGLIHWQALRLWWKGAAFRTRPSPPTEETSK